MSWKESRYSSLCWILRGLVARSWPIRIPPFIPNTRVRVPSSKGILRICSQNRP